MIGVFARAREAYRKETVVLPSVEADVVEQIRARIGRKTGMKADHDSMALVWDTTGRNSFLAIEEMAVIAELSSSLTFFSL